MRGGANATTSVLWLAYLSSYQHMGRALVRCSGGCECGPVEIDAHVRSERVSVTAVQRLAVVHTAAQGGPVCALDLRILPTSSSGEPVAPPPPFDRGSTSRTPFSAPHRRPFPPGTDAPPCVTTPLRGEHKWKLLGLLLGGNLAGDACGLASTWGWTPAGVDLEG